MGILSIQIGQPGLQGVYPQVAYIDTNDTTATILTTGYLNQSVAAGYNFDENMAALVSTRATPTASAVTVGWYDISHVGNNWSLVGSNLTGAPLTSGNDTNVTLTLGGSPATALVNPASITAGWTGQLAVGRGGTGDASFTAYSVICGGTTSAGALQSVASVGSTGQVLTSNGAAALPTWQNATGTGTVNSGTAQQAAYYATTGNTVSGITISNNSALIANNSGNLASLGYATAATASTLAERDASANLTVNNLVQGYTTTATAAGTTVLTVASTALQYFTGTTTQTVTLPVTSTLALGFSFTIVNNSTGVVTVNSSGGNLVVAMASETQLVVTCILTSGTTAASWDTDYTADIIPVPLSEGGTSASLTASVGGIFYSGASAGAILAGTATANQMLQSGASAAPAWSTATWPATTVANQLLYSSATNTVAGLAAGANGVLVSSNSSVPSWLANGTAGQVLTANTGAAPSWQSVSAGGAITTINGNTGSITPTAGAVTINGGSTGLTTSGSGSTLSLAGTLDVANGGTGNTTFTAYSLICAGTTSTGVMQNVSGVGTSGQVLTSNGAAALPTWQAASFTGLSWSTVTGTTQAAAVNNGYIANNAGAVTVTLPATAAIGSVVIIKGLGAGGWVMAANSGQTIRIGNQTTSTAGSLTSANQFDTIQVTCVVANTTWSADYVYSAGLTFA